MNSFDTAQETRPHWMSSYNRALEITRCESIETALRTRRRLFVGGGAYPNKRWAVAKNTNHFGKSWR